MKRRKKKMSRLVSLLLAAVMIVTSLPQSVFTVLDSITKTVTRFHLRLRRMITG